MSSGRSSEAPFDLLILNGSIVDGSGKPAYKADVGIRGGRIVRIGRLEGAAAAEKIDARGLVVAPGFIDAHTNLEEAVALATRRLMADNFILQGVTTAITGNCGRSAPDIAAFFHKLERLKLVLNVATMVGHNTVRREVCGSRISPPTPEQLHRMEDLVGAGIDEGAVGFSTGLCYPPGLFADEDEITALVRVAAERGVAYATHIRDEGAGGMAALDEAIRTATRSGETRLHICHFKAGGRSQYGTAGARLDVVHRSAGPRMRITMDAYPYTAASSTLDYLIPEEAFRELSRPTEQARNFQRALDATLLKLRQDGFDDYSFVRVAFTQRHKDWIGLTIPEIVERLNQSSDPSARQEASWILRYQAHGDIQIIAQEMSENDLREIVRDPNLLFGSDSAVHYVGVGKPHPRGSGTFPRVLAEYVRNLKLLTLEEAVHRSTGLTAETFELPQRGFIREGFWADLVIFDPARIQDRATPQNPWAPPEGIAWVLVNGVPVVHDGKKTGAEPGRPVRRAAHVR